MIFINSLDSPLEVLQHGRDRVRRGWIQGNWDHYELRCRDGPPFEEVHCFCAAGALGFGPPDYDDVSAAQQEALEALYRFGIAKLPPDHTDEFFVGDVLDEVTVWNDSEDRTQEEVVAAFDRAIAVLLEREVNA